MHGYAFQHFMIEDVKFTITIPLIFRYLICKCELICKKDGSNCYKPKKNFDRDTSIFHRGFFALKNITSS